MSGKSILLLFTLGAFPAAAQLPLTSEAASAFRRVIEDSQGGSLACRVEPVKPFLDFSFRFAVGFIARCPLRQFGGEAVSISTMLSIRSEGGSPATLGQSISVPSLPPELRKQFDFKHLHEDLEFSGSFSAGEGRYAIELFIVDAHKRKYHKSWRAEAFPHRGEAQATVAMSPGSVAPASIPSWSGTSLDGVGLRLTVLLDAAPLNPRSLKLHAWDRGFLLGSLSSLLRQFPLASVKLIAFNLDQQRELFREEDFDRLSLRRLAEALNGLELGSVSYRTLEKQEGWAELLSGLVRNEVTTKQRADAVVFLGPTNRIERKPAMLRPPEADSLPLFYLEYCPWRGAEFPDAIEHLTNASSGTTFKLHSPGELADAIAKLQKRLLPGGVAEARVTAGRD